MHVCDCPFVLKINYTHKALGKCYIKIKNSIFLTWIPVFVFSIHIYMEVCSFGSSCSPIEKRFQSKWMKKTMRIDIQIDKHFVSIFQHTRK
jgi:hypothetical protein